MMCAVYGHHAAVYEGRCICMNCKTPLTIVIDNGQVFFGTLAQFHDCVFSDACVGAIEEWCADQGYTLEFERERAPS